jgi:hypothetical protein
MRTSGTKIDGMVIVTRAPRAHLIDRAFVFVFSGKNHRGLGRPFGLTDT